MSFFQKRVGAGELKSESRPEMPGRDFFVRYEIVRSFRAPEAQILH
jgi:hypothetical protein